jgi:hypothetical protein
MKSISRQICEINRPISIINKSLNPKTNPQDNVKHSSTIQDMQRFFK